MNVIYEINSEKAVLRITEKENVLSVTCGAATLGWGVQGKSTLKETLADQKQKIIRQLENLDKTNIASKKGLQFLLKELEKESQLELF